MASMVWRKALGTRATPILLLLSFGALALIALHPDAGLLDKPEKVIENGQAVVSTLTLLGVIFLGGTQIALELQDRSVLFWLAHPLARWRYVLGKLLGACVIGWGLVVFLGGALALLLAVRGIFPSAMYYEYLGTELLRVLMLAALLTCLSTGLGYMQTTFIGGVLCLAGLASYVLPIYATIFGTSTMGWLLWMLYWLIPSWNHFGFGLEICSATGTLMVYWPLLVVYSVAYAAFFSILAVLSFQWRDIN